MDRQLENAFLTALEQNQQKLLRVCSVYAEDPEDKKDLFQEAVINIWQAMPSFEKKSSLSTWMWIMWFTGTFYQQWSLYSYSYWDPD
jgi:RNA polymerase sigma factor (sigma-70 family)